MLFSAAALFFLHPMDKLSNYFRATIEEMRYNVTWPSTTELQKSAGLVLVGSLVFAVVVGIMDVSFESVLKAFYNSFR
jgi:preprotein translocase subunit SecE